MGSSKDFWYKISEPGFRMDATFNLIEEIIYEEIRRLKLKRWKDYIIDKYSPYCFEIIIGDESIRVEPYYVNDVKVIRNHTGYTFSLGYEAFSDYIRGMCERTVEDNIERGKANKLIRKLEVYSDQLMYSSFSIEKSSGQISFLIDLKGFEILLIWSSHNNKYKVFSDDGDITLEYEEVYKYVTSLLKQAKKNNVSNK